MVNGLCNHFRSMSGFLAFSLVLLVVLYASQIDNINAINQSLSLANQTSGNDNYTSALIMRTDKTVYNLGELVKFLISNTGTKPLVYPDSTLGLVIKNLNTNTTYSVYSVPRPTTLKPNETMVLLHYYQKKTTNNTNAPPGVYAGYLPSEVSPICLTFRIVLSSNH